MRISDWSSDVCSSDLLTSQLLNYDLVSCGNTILLAARAHNSEHGLSLHSSMLMRKTNGQAKCLRAGSRSATGLRQVCQRLWRAAAAFSLPSRIRMPHAPATGAPPLSSLRKEPWTAIGFPMLP